MVLHFLGSLSKMHLFLHAISICPLCNTSAVLQPDICNAIACARGSHASDGQIRFLPSHSSCSEVADLSLSTSYTTNDQLSFAMPSPMSRIKHMNARPPGSRCQAGRAARVPQNCPPWRAAHCPQRWHIVQPQMWRRFTLPRRAQHGLPQRHVVCTTQVLTWLQEPST